MSTSTNAWVLPDFTRFPHDFHRLTTVIDCYNWIGTRLIYSSPEESVKFKVIPPPGLVFLSPKWGRWGLTLLLELWGPFCYHLHKPHKSSLTKDVRQLVRQTTRIWDNLTVETARPFWQLDGSDNSNLRQLDGWPRQVNGWTVELCQCLHEFHVNSNPNPYPNPNPPPPFPALCRLVLVLSQVVWQLKKRPLSCPNDRAVSTVEWVRTVEWSDGRVVWTPVLFKILFKTCCPYCYASSVPFWKR